MMLDDRAIQRAIEEIVRRRLSTERISAVDVTSDYDGDGDPVLRITVVFKAAPSSRDAQKMIRLLADIRARLREARPDSFPLVNFVSKNEAAKLQLAAA
jgi:hypothetical protein